jgi:hypothetical protein
MEYHYVVRWSEGIGWEIDWINTIKKFNNGKTVFIPNLNEWDSPVDNSEMGVQENKLVKELEEALNNIKKGVNYG